MRDGVILSTLLSFLWFWKYKYIMTYFIALGAINCENGAINLKGTGVEGNEGGAVNRGNGAIKFKNDFVVKYKQ